MNTKLLLLAGLLVLVATGLVLVQQLTSHPFPTPDRETAESDNDDDDDDDDGAPVEITWSPPNIEVTLSPGEDSTSTVTFTSNSELEDLVLEADGDVAQFLRVSLPLTAVSLVLILPLNYFWWRLIGVLP